LTSLVDDYFDDVISRLVALKRDARTGIERAIEAILGVIQSDGRVFVFGTGHSHVIAEENHYRASGLAITVPILTGATTVKDGRGGYCLRANARHRRANPGAIWGRPHGLADHRVKFWRECRSIEAARVGKEAGAMVVALTSEDYSRQAAKGRPRIADLADIVLDNGSPRGDAVIAIPGTPLR
jgi:uncharacterized phosphosugar-binding protein